MRETHQRRERGSIRLCQVRPLFVVTPRYLIRLYGSIRSCYLERTKFEKIQSRIHEILKVNTVTRKLGNQASVWDTVKTLKTLKQSFRKL